MNDRLALDVEHVLRHRAVLQLLVVNSVNVDIGGSHLQRHGDISAPQGASCELRGDAAHARDVITWHMVIMAWVEYFTVNSVYVVLSTVCGRLLVDASEYTVEALLLAHYTVV